MPVDLSSSTKKTIMILSLIFCCAPAFVYAQKISVPFSAQAPEGNWGQPWQDACEETSIVMVDSFYQKKTLDKTKAKQGILRILEIKKQMFGWSWDEGTDKITGIINSFLPWEAKIVKDPTLEQMKEEIDNQHPIIIPVHGKSLKNPHFKNNGPDYHVLVITGYDDQTKQFITNEPGTRYGLDFKYKYDTIMSAMHDFTWRGNTINGAKTAIFTQKELTSSADTDSDNDGLSKQKEIENNTDPWLEDTDNDDYLDGVEVETEYSPLIDEKKLTNGSLIKYKDSPEVYLLTDKTKRHIVNEQIFLAHSWKWENIKTVSKKFISQLETDLPLFE